MRARSFPIVVLSLVAAAAPVSAQMPPPEAQCPAPTVNECYSNPDRAGSYFQSECGQQQLWAMSWDAQSACNQIITERARGQWPATRPGLAAVPAGMPVAGAFDQDRDYIAPVDLVPFDPAVDPVKVRGGVGTYTGGRQRLDFSASSSSTTLNPNATQSAAASTRTSGPTIAASTTTSVSGREVTP